MSHIEGLRLVRSRRWAPYENCTAPSILHFPYLGLPDGPSGVVLPTVFLIYCYLCLTLLCSVYFLPALSGISDRLSGDLVRATVMVVAASVPELAISLIGTFFTEEDLGASAIVGSAVFNTLVIPASCALFATHTQVNALDVWALSRDCMMYGLSLLCLALFFQGDIIQWYEALILVLLYFLYLAGMQMDKILKRRTVTFYYRLKEEIFETSPLRKIGGNKFYGGDPEFFSSCDEACTNANEYSQTILPGKKVSIPEKMYKCIVWPINQSMKYSIPNSNPWFSLIACCVWIAILIYVTSWMITVIGYKLGLPDSLMGLTVLGSGVGLPELFISLHAAQRGKGTMALCSALGSNIINTLLCLGLPWLLKMAILGTPGILFNTDGLSYSCLLIFSMVTVLYLVLAANKFILDKKIGWLLLILYIMFFIMSVLIEMNVFFKANLPLCNIKDYFND